MNKVLIIIASILIVVLIAFGVVFFLVFSPPRQQASEVDKPGHMYHTGAVFVTNLKDSSALLKSDIIIEVQDKKSLKDLEKNNHRVRDRIILILRNISDEDMTTEGFEEVLKTQIKSDLQNTIKIDKIKEIYFNELVVQ